MEIYYNSLHLGRNRSSVAQILEKLELFEDKNSIHQFNLGFSIMFYFIIWLCTFLKDIGYLEMQKLYEVWKALEIPYILRAIPTL